MSIVRLAYVICSECGVPASDVRNNTVEAREAMPEGWVTIRTGRRAHDYCPRHHPSEPDPTS